MTKGQLQSAFFVSLFGAVVLVTFFIIAPYLGALALAILLGVIFAPVYRFLVRLIRFEWLASLLTVLLVAVLVLTPLSLLTYKIFQQATNLYVGLASQSDGNVAGALLSSFDKFAGKFSLLGNFHIDFGQYIRQALAWFVEHLGFFFSGITQVLLTIVLGLLSLFYFLKDGQRLKEYLIELLPMEKTYSLKILERMHRAINSVVIGTLFVATIQGAVAGVGLAIFGVPNAAFWGSLAAITALIPSFGTALVTVPAILYLFFVGSTVSAVGMLVWALLAVGLVDNMLAPQILRYGSKMHPLVVLLGVLGGIGLFGPIGFVLGPLTFALLYALLEIYPEIVTPRDA